MKKFIALPMEERQLRMNGKMIILTFFKLHRNQKGFLVSPVYKHLKGIFVVFCQKRPV